MTKKSLGIYVIGDVAYFKPNAQLKNGPMTMMEFTGKCRLADEDQLLGATLLKSLDECGYYETTPETNHFKELIKITKTKSHIGLIRKAKYVKVSLQGNLITLLRVDANYKYKAFCEKSEIPKQLYDIGQENLTELGKKIRITIS